MILVRENDLVLFGYVLTFENNHKLNQSKLFWWTCQLYARPCE